jgi:hypothetical protein
MTASEAKTRRRRSAAERLAAIEAQAAEIRQTLQKRLAALEARKRQIREAPARRSSRLQDQRAFLQRLDQLHTGWDYPQILAAVAQVHAQTSQEKEADLATMGEELWESLQPRRGRSKQRPD